MVVNICRASDVFGENITNSRKLSDAVVDRYSDDYDEIATSKANGTYYVIGKAGSETTLIGCYVEGDYNWLVQITSDDYASHKTNMIKYVTLGEVEDGYVPGESDGDSDDEPVNTKPTAPSQDATMPPVDATEPAEDATVAPTAPTEPAEDATVAPTAPTEPAEDATVPPTADTEPPTSATEHPPVLEPAYVLKVAVPYEDREWIVQMQAAFAQAYPQYRIAWENITLSEGDAGVIVAADPTSGPDVYMYANDQIGALVTAGGLMKLESQYLQQVYNDNSMFMINTVTHTDGNVYGYPVTNNTWFMYYNKAVFTEEDARSLDAMLTKGKVVLPMTIGWNAGCFFLGCGGTVFGEKGNDAAAGIQFGEINGGYLAAQKMVELKNHPNVICGGMDIRMLVDGEVDAAFSGSWYAAYAKQLGDKLGVAMLPTFTVDGREYQMKALSGSKCVGVNAASIGLDAEKKQIAMDFSAFLASADGQLSRYEHRGVIPAAKSLMSHPTIQRDPVALAEIKTVTYAAVVQPGLPEMANYWGPMQDFANQISTGQITMQNYTRVVDELMKRLNGNSL